MFTVPRYGAGLYYIYAHLRGDDSEYSTFYLRKDGNTLCSMELDAGDFPAASCAATVKLAEGKYDSLILFYHSRLLEIKFSQQAN